MSETVAYFMAGIYVLIAVWILFIFPFKYQKIPTAYKQTVIAIGNFGHLNLGNDWFSAHRILKSSSDCIEKGKPVNPILFKLIGEKDHKEDILYKVKLIHWAGLVWDIEIIKTYPIRRISWQ